MSNGQSKSGTEGKDKLTPDAMYNSITQLVVNSESICWNRFYHYLVAVTLLTLAWVGLFTTKTHPHMCRYLSIVVAFVGFIISFQWRGLLERSRAFLDLYVDLGCRVEKIGDTAAKKLTDLLDNKWDDYKDKKKENLYKDLYKAAKIDVNKFGSILPFIVTKIELKRLEEKMGTGLFYTSTQIFNVVTIAFMVLFCLLVTASIYSLIFLLIAHVKHTVFALYFHSFLSLVGSVKMF